MKSFHVFFQGLRLSTVAMAFLMAVAMTSCSKKVTFQTSSVVPAAQGTVKVKTDKNKNYKVKIDIANLAEPERLSPPRETYVVWMATEQDDARNIGQIKSSKGTFSKGLSASFETVSASKPVKVFITAENDPDTRFPGGVIVLTTNRL
jgi:hypothetical protein